MKDDPELQNLNAEEILAANIEKLKQEFADHSQKIIKLNMEVKKEKYIKNKILKIIENSKYLDLELTIQQKLTCLENIDPDLKVNDTLNMLINKENFHYTKPIDNKNDSEIIQPKHKLTKQLKNVLQGYKKKNENKENENKENENKESDNTANGESQQNTNKNQNTERNEAPNEKSFMKEIIHTKNSINSQIEDDIDIHPMDIITRENREIQAFYSGDSLIEKEDNLVKREEDEFAKLDWQYCLVFPNPDYNETIKYMKPDETIELYDNCFLVNFALYN